jgi:pimeloyl-ACP methyl ester carboxylesterase
MAAITRTPRSGWIKEGLRALAAGGPDAVPGRGPGAGAAFATFMGEAIPGATVHIIEGQGHFAHLEVAERFNPLLADALQIPKDLVPAR